MAAFNLTNNCRQTARTEEPLKYLDRLAIPADGFLRAVARPEAPPPASEVFIDLAALYLSELRCHLLPQRLTEPTVGRCRSRKLLAGFDALCSMAEAGKATKFPGEDHFVGADGLEPPTCSL